MPCSLPDRARILSVVGTRNCQADAEETDTAKAVEEFHVVEELPVYFMCWRKQ